MVRLELTLYGYIESVFRISIPLWCDWNQKAKNSYCGYKPFQFHYGAIGTPVPFPGSLSYIHFNSIMVRLEQRH